MSVSIERFQGGFPVDCGEAGYLSFKHAPVLCDLDDPKISGIFLDMCSLKMAVQAF